MNCDRPTETSTLPLPIPPLQTLSRSREAGEENQGMICLDRNERVEPWPDWFLAKVRESVNGELLSKYPVTDSLYRKLSETVGLTKDQLLMTPGSDGGIKAIFHSFVRPGDTVVMLDPSYAMFKVYARMFEARVRPVAFSTKMEIDAQQLLESVESGVRVIFIANPNQPTGTLLDEDLLLGIAARAQRIGALLVVDEAYFPFSRTTILPRVGQHDHLVVTRSFSKAGGLAGLRVGFVAAHHGIISNLYKVRSTYDVNSMALLLVSLLLEYPEVVEDSVKEALAGGLLLAERSRAMGLEPIPTSGNFLLIRVSDRCSPAWLIDKLRENGYLVRGPYEAPCLQGCIRVSLAHRQIMSAFADCMKRIIEAGN